MKLLEGKTAIITGGARGIGKSIAQKFASEGSNVAIVDLIKDDSVLAFESELKAMGINAKTYTADVAIFNDVQNIVSQIVSDFGKVDILVNNAGITKDSALKRMTEEQWDAVLSVNLKSVFNFSKAIQPVMWKQGNGSIINMSSVVGVSGNANQSNYSASKAGMIGFTKSIAKELGIRGIRCNAIAPGFIITEMTAQLPQEVRDEWISRIPLKRGGTPEDVANIALFLASELSSYVNGQVINVCGGMNT